MGSTDREGRDARHGRFLSFFLLLNPITVQHDLGCETGAYYHYPYMYRCQLISSSGAVCVDFAQIPFF